MRVLVWAAWLLAFVLAPQAALAVLIYRFWVKRRAKRLLIDPMTLKTAATKRNDISSQDWVKINAYSD